MLMPPAAKAHDIVPAAEPSMMNALLLSEFDIALQLVSVSVALPPMEKAPEAVGSSARRQPRKSSLFDAIAVVVKSQSSMPMKLPRNVGTGLSVSLVRR